MAHLYIIRGLPGSGKTTLAQAMLSTNMVQSHYEADMWMIDDFGDYCFNADKLSDCHNHCFRNTCDALLASHAVAVSNTFTRHWEYDKYVDFCLQRGIGFTVLICQGNYPNIHGVPEAAIERMRKRFEL